MKQSERKSFLVFDFFSKKKLTLGDEGGEAVNFRDELNRKNGFAVYSTLLCQTLHSHHVDCKSLSTIMASNQTSAKGTSSKKMGIILFVYMY